MKNYNDYKEEAIAILCSRFKITREKMFSKSRKREYADARFLLALWIKENTKKSLVAIGVEVRDIPYDHTSVLHCICEAKNLLVQDSNAHNIYNQLPTIPNYSLLSKSDFPFPLLSAMQYAPKF